MSEYRFEWEEGWEEKAFHFRSSLNPLGDAVREATDEIGLRARQHAEVEAARWKDSAKTTKGLLKKSFRQEKLRYFRAKAMAYSLDLYVKTLRFTMERGEAEGNYGTVTSYHAAGDRIEFGGVDSKVELGKKTGQFLDYPAYAFLRRALNGG